MRAIVILGLALGGSHAFAQDLGVYTGLSIGAFEHNNETGGAFSDSASSWRLYGGFQAGKYFSLEFGRGSTGAINVDAPGGRLTIATRRLQTATHVDFALTTFKAMGRLPLRRFDLWFAYGTFFMDADVDFTTSTGGHGSLSVDDSNELFAFGVDWKLGEIDRLYDVRLEYEKLNMPFSDASTIAVGVAYRFGGL